MKEDFLHNGCIQALQKKENRRVIPDEITKHLCQQCRNHECSRAGWVESQWLFRMQNQRKWLLDDPQFADLEDPHWKTVQMEHAIEDRFQSAMAIEAHARRGDWAPLDEEPLSKDGVNEVEQDTDAFDAAMQALAALKGKKVPKIPKLTEGVESPLAPPGTRDQKLVQIRTVLKKEDPSQSAKTYQPPPESSQAPSAMAQAAPEPPGAAEAPELPESSQEPPAQPQPPQKAFYPGNTPVPQGGILLPGAPPPQKRQPPPDPWAPKEKKNVVKPGARIRMGGKGKK